MRGAEQHLVGCVDRGGRLHHPDPGWAVIHLPQPPAGGPVPLRPGGPGHLPGLRRRALCRHHPGGPDHPPRPVGAAGGPGPGGEPPPGGVSRRRDRLDPVHLEGGARPHPPRRPGELLRDVRPLCRGPLRRRRRLLPPGLGDLRPPDLVHPGGPHRRPPGRSVRPPAPKPAAVPLKRSRGPGCYSALLAATGALPYNGTNQRGGPSLC